MDDVYTFLGTAACLIVIAGIFFYSIWWRKKQLQGFAESNNLSFDEHSEKQRIQNFILERRDLRLFGLEQSERMCRHAMTGELDGSAFAVSEIRTVAARRQTRSNQSQRGEYYTVAIITNTSFSFPSMHLEPEGLGWKMTTALFGFQDIDFAEHKDFSKKYVLQGEDEEAIRTFFTRELMDALVANPICMFDASGDTLMVYLKKAAHKPKKLQQLVDNAKALQKVFLEQQTVS